MKSKAEGGRMNKKTTQSTSETFILPPSSFLLAFRSPEFDGGLVGRGGEEVAEGLLEDGMIGIGDDFGEGGEDESAEV